MIFEYQINVLRKRTIVRLTVRADPLNNIIVQGNADISFQRFHIVIFLLIFDTAIITKIYKIV